MIEQFANILSSAVSIDECNVFNTVRNHSNSRPYIIFQKITDNRRFQVSLCEGPREALIQTEIYSDKNDKALLDLTDEVEGIVGKYTNGKIQTITQENQSFDYEEKEELHVVRTEFLIIYTKTE